MTPDPTRILALAQTFESGTTEEKLDVIAGLDVDDPISSGILMRALDDAATEVRLQALKRLDEAGVRPISPLLNQLLNDEEPEVRELAQKLKERPDALNPLERLVPMVERLADSLGPLGGMLRGMIGTLRDVGAEDERTQLMALNRLQAGDPTAVVAIHTALQSPHISVRITALTKAEQLPQVTVPEELIGQFVTDPSPDVRGPAERLVRAGKVGPFDSGAFRSQTMQSMLGGLMGGTEGAGPGLDLSALSGLFSGGGAGGSGPGFDLNALSELFGGGAAEPREHTTPADTSGEPVGSADTPHAVRGRIYVVGDERVRDRLVRSLSQRSGGADERDVVQLRSSAGSLHWAIEATPPLDVEQAPGWVALLSERGLHLAESAVGRAEGARFLSEQVWGAAYADHQPPVPFTLVFHDGMLSRAVWAGDRAGAWSAERAGVQPSPAGPIALLTAFLADPTDDKLTALATPSGPLFELSQ